MENILFEKEVCNELKLPSIPRKEWDGESSFAKGVAIVKMDFGRKGYAIARFDNEKENKPNIVKVFSLEPFFDIEKIFIVPEYMETDLHDADLDEESKKKAQELVEQANEIVDDKKIDTEESEQENEYLFDNITNDEEAIAFISAYNKKNNIKGSVPKKHETILMRLAVIYSEQQKASGFNGNK